MLETSSNLRKWTHRLRGHSVQNPSFDMLCDDICKSKTKVFFIIYLTPSFRSFQIFYKKKLAYAYFPSVSQPCYVSVISALTVFEEEVKRSEMWKLTCQECKVNTIRAGKRKQKS